jgi:phage FluMu protein Com
MNLQPVAMRKEIAQVIRCIRCKCWAQEVYADLDGKAFVDYYCPECAQEVKP